MNHTLYSWWTTQHAPQHAPQHNPQHAAQHAPQTHSTTRHNTQTKHTHWAILALMMIRHSNVTVTATHADDDDTLGCWRWRWHLWCFDDHTAILATTIQAQWSGGDQSRRTLNYLLHRPWLFLDTALNTDLDTWMTIDTLMMTDEWWEDNRRESSPLLV